MGSRLACLTCMNASFTDTTDLCTSCIRNSCDLRGFVHDPSHVLLKFDTLVLDANMHWIIPKARSMLPRIQKELRSSRPKLEEQTGPASGWYSSQSKSEMLTIKESTPLPKCGSCKEMISMPCWVYVEYCMFFLSSSKHYTSRVIHRANRRQVYLRQMRFREQNTGKWLSHVMSTAKNRRCTCGGRRPRGAIGGA